MKLFIITSPKFEGPAEILYNEAGILVKIDLTKTAMSAITVMHFKQTVPPFIDNLVEAFEKTQVTIVEADYIVTFEAFYREYPLKRNAYRVEGAFKALSKTDQVKAFASLKSYKKYLSRNAWQTPMIGDRYLKSREFETDWNKI